MPDDPAEQRLQRLLKKNRDCLRQVSSFCFPSGTQVSTLKGLRSDESAASGRRGSPCGRSAAEYEPPDIVQFTDEETQVAVIAAADWNTYVTAHVYDSRGIRRAVDNGVKCIEHANPMDEPTLKYMMEKAIWLSPQVIVYTYHPKVFTEDQTKKHDQACGGIHMMFTAAKKIGVKNVAFGSDIITDPDILDRINEEFVQRRR